MFTAFFDWLIKGFTVVNVCISALFAFGTTVFFYSYLMPIDPMGVAMVMVLLTVIYLIVLYCIQLLETYIKSKKGIS